jgi:hypothetical protein
MMTRNFFIYNGHGLYTTEYHKARAWTNYSFYVVRYLPQRVTELALLYIAYIRPFACMLYSRRGETCNDAKYLFCSDKSLDKCWDGRVLTKILQKESMERLGSKLSIWAFRHIIIGITKVHVKEISGYFEKDNRVKKDPLRENADAYLYAWQAGHQRETNVGIYGLDAAFPTRLQPELLGQFLRISLRWHHYLGPGVAEEKDIEGSDGRGKRKMVDCATQMTPPKKRKTIDCTTQVTPKKENRPGNFMNEMDSPETKKLKGQMIDIARKLQLRKERK